MHDSNDLKEAVSSKTSLVMTRTNELKGETNPRMALNLIVMEDISLNDTRMKQ